MELWLKEYNTIPGAIIQPLIYSSFIYVVVGFNGNYENFLLFITPIILSAFSASAIGYLMSAVFESVNAASLLSVPIDFVTLIFSGIFLQIGNLPSYISWIKYISQFYYGVEAVSLTQWQGIHYIASVTIQGVVKLLDRPTNT
ncbi:hypothetical protein TSAR_007761 [Trichomalopsis sarcophagae]|uniref:ABC-2 type transporter transmembrane domain-containing protein n=1 Tax=Trichomalopsis sarcophagae TaxID=543379 RepID=A0A232F796_9HYME|nr:hypothetical protein TSAR_007761 [Trichomalopsis sarcophagae]